MALRKGNALLPGGVRKTFRILPESRMDQLEVPALQARSVKSRERHRQEYRDRGRGQILECSGFTRRETARIVGA